MKMMMTTRTLPRTRRMENDDVDDLSPDNNSSQLEYPCTAVQFSRQVCQSDTELRPRLQLSCRHSWSGLSNCVCKVKLVSYNLDFKGAEN